MKMVNWINILRLLLLVSISILSIAASDATDQKKKKDLNAFTDADFERLSQQWEKDDEELPEDELPPWKKQKSPVMNLDNMDLSNPEALLKATKKGQSVMLFATVSGNPDKSETETISTIWMRGLFNAHIEVQLYPVEDQKIIFMVVDGAQAWQAKEFLVSQERCLSINLEGQTYPGKGDASSSSSKNEGEL